MRKAPFISAIVVGGGAGTRFNHQRAKQFVNLDRRPIIVHSLEKFQKNRFIQEIIAVVPKGFVHYFGKRILSRYKLDKISKLVIGGKTRQESVNSGLQAIDPRARFVLVHDAVRPLVSENEIRRLIKAVQKRKAVILAIPVKDTVKEVNGAQIVRTLSREKFWLVQTPQAFEVNLLKKAYLQARKDRFQGTDCSSLVERLGVKVGIVAGSSRNIKITDREDLELAQNLLH